MIPRIIHQTWKTSDIPDRLAKYQQTWKNFHPSWTYVLWDDEAIEKLITDEFPWFLETWHSYPHHIQRVDAFRYFVMAKYGGVYADLDMQCLTAFDPLIAKATGVVVGQEGQQHKDGTMRVGNAILLSPPDHPLWEHVFQAMLNNASKSTEKLSSVFETTGPSMLHEVVRNHPQDVAVMNSSAFYPIPWHMPEEKAPSVTRKQFPQSWAAHHWEGTWRNAPKIYEIRGMKFAVSRKKANGYGIVEKTISGGELWRPTVVDTFEQCLEAGDLAVIIGAYTGTLVIPAALLVGPTGRVVAFEPDRRNVVLLQEAIRLNKLSDTVDVRAAGVATRTPIFKSTKWDPRKPHRTIWRPSRAGSSQRQGPVETAEAVVLDDSGLDRISLIHIDANGEELEALTSSAQLIRTYEPIITLEIWNDEKRQMYASPYNQAQTMTALRDLGYDVTHLEGDAFVATPQ